MLIRFADPDSSGGVELLATLPLAASTCPSYHDAARDRLVSAGPSDAGGILTVGAVSLTNGSWTPLANVPSVLDVTNNLIVDGAHAWSYDASGMTPTQVPAACPKTHL